MPFPVIVYDQTFQYSDFYPQGYVTALPASLAKLADIVSRPRTWASTSSNSIGIGLLIFTIAPGVWDFSSPSNWRSSVRVWASNTQYMDGRVTAYDVGTGQLAVDVYSAVGAGLFTAWTISVLTRQVITNSFIPIGADRGGTGGGEGSLDNREILHTLRLPHPDLGFLLEEDFVFNKETLTGPWVGEAQSLVSILPGGMGEGNKLFGFGAAWHAAGTNPALTQPILAHGVNGYISVAGPGDTFFTTTANFSNQTYYAAGNPIFYVGLRGNLSSMNTIFDRYGIGFESVLVAGNARHWYGIVCIGGVQTRTFLLASNNTVHLSIFVDALSLVAYLGASESAAISEPPGYFNMYSMSVDISTWPEDNPAAFVHPAASANGYSVLSQGMFLDKVFLHKALER